MSKHDKKRGDKFLIDSNVLLNLRKLDFEDIRYWVVEAPPGTGKSWWMRKVAEDLIIPSHL
jgi:hypothetical protein